MRHALALVVLVLIGAAAVAAGAQAVSSPEALSTFLASLETCTAGTANTPHPLIPGFIVVHTSNGPTDGACGYRQTMPGNMTMVCALSERGRSVLAADIRAMMAGGSMRGSTSAAPPAWMQECEIEMANGRRIPAAPAARPRGN